MLRLKVVVERAGEGRRSASSSSRSSRVQGAAAGVEDRGGIIPKKPALFIKSLECTHPSFTREKNVVAPSFLVFGGRKRRVNEWPSRGITWTEIGSWFLPATLVSHSFPLALLFQHSLVRGESRPGTLRVYPPTGHRSCVRIHQRVSNDWYHSR